MGMLMSVVKRWMKKLTSRTLVLKFYYTSSEAASRVFNNFYRFFTLNKDNYQILKSSIEDDYLYSDHYIVFFKVREFEKDLQLDDLLERMIGYRAGEQKEEMKECCKTKKGFNQ